MRETMKQCGCTLYAGVEEFICGMCPVCWNRYGNSTGVLFGPLQVIVPRGTLVYLS